MRGLVSRKLLPGAVAVMICAVVTACSSGGTNRSGGDSAAAAPPRPSGPSSPVSKVLVIVEENHTLSEAKADMPFLMAEAEQYGYASGYQAVAQPSLPNYLAITGGSTFGVTDDDGPDAHPLSGPSVFGQVLAAGKSARVFAESQPSNCATDDTGDYAVRHTGWPYYTDERAECQANQVDLGALPAAINSSLPTVALVVPNLCNDAHNCSLGTADDWLRAWVPRVTSGPDFSTGRLAVVVTFDEGSDSDQQVLTVVLHKSLHGKVVGAPLTHFSLTGLIDDAAHLPKLREAAAAPSMKDAFGLAT
jgi:acid phosphatase